MIGLVRAAALCATLVFGLVSAEAADKAFKRDDLGTLMLVDRLKVLHGLEQHGNNFRFFNAEDAIISVADRLGKHGV